MELWDAYDVRGNSLEHTLIRGEGVPAGEYHLVADILVRHTDGSFLLTQRDPQKPAFPGCWELSAGGSVLAGETALSGAMRELREETGIQADALAPAFEITWPGRHASYHGYVCRYAGDKEAITLQPGETVAYRWLTLWNRRSSFWPLTADDSDYKYVRMLWYFRDLAVWFLNIPLSSDE